MSGVILVATPAANCNTHPNTSKAKAFKTWCRHPILNMVALLTLVRGAIVVWITRQCSTQTTHIAAAFCTKVYRPQTSLIILSYQRTYLWKIIRGITRDNPRCLRSSQPIWWCQWIQVRWNALIIILGAVAAVHRSRLSTCTSKK